MQMTYHVIQRHRHVDLSHIFLDISVAAVTQEVPGLCAGSSQVITAVTFRLTEHVKIMR